MVSVVKMEAGWPGRPFLLILALHPVLGLPVVAQGLYLCCSADTDSLNSLTSLSFHCSCGFSAALTVKLLLNGRNV